MATQTVINVRKTKALSAIISEVNAMCEMLGVEELNIPLRARDEAMLQVIQLEGLAKIVTQLNDKVKSPTKATTKKA